MPAKLPIARGAPSAPVRPSASARRAAVSAVVFALGVYAIWHRFGSAPTLYNQYDDAYITYRYAANFAMGRGLVFNAGEPTDAASSFLYTLLLAVPYRLGLHDLGKVATALGVCSAALVGVIVYDTTLRLTRRWFVAAPCAFVSVYHGFISGWATSGMETCFYSALVAAFVARVFFLRRNDALAVALLIAILLTRIEGGIVAVAWGVVVARDVVAGGPAQRRRVLRFAGIVAAVTVTYYAGKYLRYGTPLPHSYLFKRISLEHQPDAQATMYSWQMFGLPVLVMAGAGLTLLRRDAYSVALVLFAGVSVLSVLRGPVSHFSRYSSHLLPVAVLMGASAFDLLLRRLPVGALAFALWAGATTVESFEKTYEFAHWYAGHQSCRKAVGQFVEAHADRTRPVMSSDIGEVAYMARDVSFIDTFGLTSSDVMESYARGRPPDAILRRKRPAMVADTKGTSGFKALGFLGGSQLVRPSSPSVWLSGVTIGPDLFQCTAPDGIVFAVAPIEAR